MTTTQRLWIWRASLLIFSIFVAWRTVMTGMSDHYLGQAKKGHLGAAQKALAWDDRNPRALTLAGASLLDRDAERARELMEKAVRQNPADARPLLGLAELERRDNDLESTDRLVRLSTRLMPVNSDILKAAAGYWVSREALETAIELWSTALESDPRQGEELFPIFSRIAESSAVRASLTPLTQTPPKWWQRFFVLFSRDTQDIQNLRAVFEMRRESERFPPTQEERPRLSS